MSRIPLCLCVGGAFPLHLVLPGEYVAPLPNLNMGVEKAALKCDVNFHGGLKGTVHKGRHVNLGTLIPLLHTAMHLAFFTCHKMTLPPPPFV